MNKLTDKKRINGLTWLCTIAYFVSYVSRVNLSACMVEMVRSNYAPETTIALALTVCSVVYGIGQVVSGYLGDRCKPQNLLAIGFLITACTNFTVGLLKDGNWLVVLWGINGFAHALMWPPMVAIMSSRMHPADYQNACLRVSWGSSVGTITVYLLSPVLISLLNVRWVFLCSAVVALTMLVVWHLSFRKHFAEAEPMKKVGKEPVARQAVPFEKWVLLLMCAVFVCILVQGFLRDGVTNWTPTYISQIFDLSSSAAILSGVILPVFSIISLKLASEIQKRFLKNELICAAAFFAASCVAALVLALAGGASMILSLVCLAVLVGCMHGVNLMLIGLLPKYFERYGRVSLVSGVLNAGTYAGSALSAYGMAVYTADFGWQSTTFLWAGVALAGVMLCVAVGRKWQSFKR